MISQGIYLAVNVDLRGRDGQACFVLQQEHGILDHGQITLCGGVQPGGRAGPANVVEFRNLVRREAQLLGGRTH